MDSESEKLKAQLDDALRQLQQVNAEKAELQRRLTPSSGGAPAPNWLAWKAAPKVALWEAVALSLGVEPTPRVLQAIQAGRQPTSRFNRSSVPLETFERLQHCKRALGVNGPIVPQSLYVGALSDSKCPVLLTEVVTFLLAGGFSLPPELDGLAALSDAANPPPELSTEERQDARLKMCEDAGLTFNKHSLARLPDGIGEVAEAAGVTRQTFSADVKKAVKRRFEKLRDGRG